ncbi:MAG TPA: ABC transporter permease [Edaphobacter sp.]|nr:ABC transporter permease [Edaphobacter sp.]
MRLWRWLHQRREEDDLDEELQSHLRMAIAERRERGESEESARAAVLREFGNVLLVKEVTRNQWGSRWGEALMRDVRRGLRQLRKSPAFTITAVVMLALGIGANTAVFSIFNQVVLRTLPVRNPHQLVLLSQKSASTEGSWSSWGDDTLYFSYPAYVALRDGNHTLDGLAASAFSGITLVTQNFADNTIAEYVTGNYFDVLGVRPILGRLIKTQDDRLHAGNPVAVLSEDYWQSHFGSDTSILNRVVKINGQSFTVVGIVGYRGLTGEYIPAIFIPMAMQHAVMAGRDHGHDRLTDDLFYWINLIGRLKPGVTQAYAQQELNSLWLDWHRSAFVLLQHHHGKKFDREWMQTKLSLRDGSQGLGFLESALGDPVRVLFWMVSIVLLIACANLANLLLIKANARQREWAVQHALGASRWQLCRQTLVEGLLLGILGSVVGLLLGMVTLRVILRMIPDTYALKQALLPGLDWRVMIFAVLLGITTSLVFSLAPTLISLQVDPLQALHAGSRTVIGRRSNPLNFIVIGEIALSMTLLVSAGLVAMTLYRLRTLNLGYTTTHLTTFSVDASLLNRQNAEVKNEYKAIETELRHLPGVTSVSYASIGMLAGDESGSSVAVRGFTETGPSIEPDRNWVTPGFLPGLQIPLLAGRNFAEQDSETSQKVAIVDEDFVKHYFHGNISAALDGQMAWGNGTGVKTDIQIVGVVPVVRSVSLTHNANGPMVYMPYAQSWSNGRSHPATFYLRTMASSAGLAADIRAAVRRVDHDLPITDVETMQERVNNSIFQQRLMATLAFVMGALALLLSAIGLYGVLAYAVAQRIQEIAIRIALGASKQHVSRMLMQRMLILVGTGVLAGVPLAWLGTRFMASMATLTGNATWVFLFSASLLFFVCMLAGSLPTRRATSVEPIRVLRAE